MPKLQVVHASSPVCSWSWGYAPIVNRLRLVYGSQIDVVVGQAIPYTDRAQWLVDYEMTDAEAVDFEREIHDAIGLPMRIVPSWTAMPASCLPAAAAVKAAGLAFGATAERRLARRLMNAFLVDGRDTSDEGVIADVVREAGLDLDATLKAAGDDATQALEGDAQRLGHGANFYSLLVRDGKGTTIALERAYDPARVESAIDWLAGRKLRKAKPTDVVGYVRENGSVSLAEVRKVFGWDAARAKAALAKAEKAGAIERRDVEGIRGGKFWAAAGTRAA